MKTVVVRLMLALAVWAGISPAAFGDSASSQFGGEVVSASFHAPLDQLHDHHGDAHDSAAEHDHHHYAYCVDHCCSDICAAALPFEVVTTASLRHGVYPHWREVALPVPTEERFIPPGYC